MECWCGDFCDEYGALWYARDDRIDLERDATSYVVEWRGILSDIFNLVYGERVIVFYAVAYTVIRDLSEV